MVAESNWVSYVPGGAPLILHDQDINVPNARLLADGDLTAIDLGTSGKVKLNLDATVRQRTFTVHIGNGEALANGTTFKRTIIPVRAGTVKSINIAASTKPAGGTNTVAVAGAGNGLLVASTFNPTGITTNGTSQALSLTATTANLTLAAGDTILVTYVSGTQTTPAEGVAIAVVYEYTS